MNRFLASFLLLASSVLAAPIIVLTADRSGAPSAPADDWFTTESARPFVVMSARIDTQAEIDDWFLDDSTGDHMTLDTTLKPAGSVGSLKHAVLNTDGSASGQFCVPFGDTFGDGETIVFAYEVYFQPEEKYAIWPPEGEEEGTASKLSILSRDCNGASPTGSNQVNEYVVQQNHTGGRISAYYQDGEQFPPLQEGSNNACSSSDILDAPQLDRGVANPLTGTNPDTGGAWTSCQQFRAQFGTMHYSARSSPGADNTIPGLGDPFSIDFAPAGEWITVQGAAVIGNFGSANNRLVLMVAREDGPWILLADVSGLELGDGPDYNGLNLLPYTTARDPGGRHVGSRSGELEACFTIWNATPSHALGTSVLSWTASTQQLTWDPPIDTAGTARGFSEANDILAVNLLSGSGLNAINGQFIPAGCPGSDATENVVISAGRPDTQRNYGNVIIGTDLFNAPDGSAPPVSL